MNNFFIQKKTMELTRDVQLAICDNSNDSTIIFTNNGWPITRQGKDPIANILLFLKIQRAYQMRVIFVPTTEIMWTNCANSVQYRCDYFSVHRITCYQLSMSYMLHIITQKNNILVALENATGLGCDDIAQIVAGYSISPKYIVSVKNNAYGPFGAKNDVAEMYSDDDAVFFENMYMSNVFEITAPWSDDEYSIDISVRYSILNNYFISNR